MSNIDISRAAELLLENYYTVKVVFDQDGENSFGLMQGRARKSRHPSLDNPFPTDKTDLRYFVDDTISSNLKHYTYKVPKELKLEVGDLCIVQVRGTKIIKLVRVMEVDAEIDIDFNFDKPYSWIVQKADIGAIDKREELDAKVRRSFEVVKKRQMRKELMTELANDLGEDAVAGLLEELGIANDLPKVGKEEKK